MNVVAYLHNADLIIEDEQGAAIIGGSHYVLSLGDRVFIEQGIDEQAKIYQVQISFGSAEHLSLHQDQIQLKFQGCHESLKQYLHNKTVH